MQELSLGDLKVSPENPDIKKDAKELEHALQSIEKLAPRTEVAIRLNILRYNYHVACLALIGLIVITMSSLGLLLILSQIETRDGVPLAAGADVRWITIGASIVFVAFGTYIFERPLKIAAKFGENLIHIDSPPREMG